MCDRVNDQGMKKARCFHRAKNNIKKQTNERI